jgi:hypothetical protein
VEAT